MRSFCLLASMELILGPNCSLLNLHSNDMNSLKSLSLKNCYSYKYVIKNKIKTVVNLIKIE